MRRVWRPAFRVSGARDVTADARRDAPTRGAPADYGAADDATDCSGGSAALDLRRCRASRDDVETNCVTSGVKVLRTIDYDF